MTGRATREQGEVKLKVSMAHLKELEDQLGVETRRCLTDASTWDSHRLELEARVVMVERAREVAKKEREASLGSLQMELEATHSKDMDKLEP